MSALVPPGWEQRRLLIQRCASCGRHQYYPRPICLACDSTDLALVEASGLGRIHSYTVVHRSVDPRFEAPYTVALVDLDEGPRLLTHVVDDEPGVVRCDAPVRLAWLEREAALPLPVFTPIRGSVPEQPLQPSQPPQPLQSPQPPEPEQPPRPARPPERPTA